MAIKFFTDKIQIGDYNLFEGNGGVQFDGVARAENFLGNQGFQGTVSAYRPGGGPVVTTIQKWPFATNTNSTNIGSLTVARANAGGHKSSVNGYTSGGYVPGPPYTNNTIDKFPFATDSNATDVGDLSQGRYSTSGHSSLVFGYISGGSPALPGMFNTIDKFPFAADTNATDVGDLTLARNSHSGQSSTTHGYASGGEAPPIGPPSSSNTIDKFPFATDSNATDVGDLTQNNRSAGSGQSSTTHGYSSGGLRVGVILNSDSIQKFPFAADASSTSVGVLTQARISSGGNSSTVSGYSSGGEVQPTPNVNTIDKFPFATDSNATDVGDLTAASRGSCTVNPQN